MKELASPDAIQASISGVLGQESRPENESEFWLIGRTSASFVGISRSGTPALLLPLSSLPEGVGRSAGGFRLSGVPSVLFETGSRSWTQPAGVLECLDPTSLDAFSSFACDVARRARRLSSGNEWQRILQVVEEWCLLLAKRKRLPIESEIGLWGELWFLLQALDIDSVIGSWSGPDADSVDFMRAGISIEVKTSRSKGQHYVSQTQVTRPKGDTVSYLLSVWVGTDPAQGETLPSLVDKLMSRVADPPSAARLLMTTGYSPTDRKDYQLPLKVLEAPLWYGIEAVPQVRNVDAGVSHLRYVIDLGVASPLPLDVAQRLLQRVLGREEWSLGEPDSQ